MSGNDHGSKALGWQHAAHDPGAAQPVDAVQPLATARCQISPPYRHRPHANVRCRRRRLDQRLAFQHLAKLCGRRCRQRHGRSADRRSEWRKTATQTAVSGRTPMCRRSSVSSIFFIARAASRRRRCIIVDRRRCGDVPGKGWAPSTQDTAKGEPPWQPVSASAEASLVGWLQPRSLTIEEIRKLVEDYRQCARGAAEVPTSTFWR
jgi:hypothetical protein